MIAAHSVGGMYCDGDVLLSLDANGAKVSTCIPDAAIQAKMAAQRADCLANCGKDRGPALNAQCVPYCGGGAASGATSPIVVALAGVAIVGLLFVAHRSL